MKRIPYGEAHFPNLIRDNSFYVDKTPFLSRLEAASKYVVFLRPRRFGKSLWISVLRHYYGCQYRGRFAEWFGDLQVGIRPTPLANAFCVLSFEFSRIDTSTEEGTQKGFMRNVQEGVQIFLADYADFFSEAHKHEILSQTLPNEMVKALFQALQINPAPYPVYLLIDEYDHFTNELITFRLQEFKDVVGKNGYVRKFYESLKTASQMGIVDRMFITGVSPITVDSLTSGFNIGAHYSTEGFLHNMIGFTEKDCETLLRNIGVEAERLPAIMDDLHHWYDGYQFAPDVTERLYNPDMVLYFADKYQQNKRYPREMLDPNIAPDYGKLRSLFRIAGREEANRQVLAEVLIQGATTAQLTVQFSFERGFTAADFKSMLFYMGYLTVKEAQWAELALQIPNEVIRRLYWDYFEALVEKDTDFAVNSDDIRAALRDFAQNDPYPLLAQVERTLEALSNRDDMKLDEKHVKAIFVSFVALAQSWFVKSEFETQRKYIDLLILRRKPYNVPYQFAIEFKYLHKNEEVSLERKRKEAQKQLRGYLQLPEIAQITDLKAWLFIFLGTKQAVAEGVI